MIHNFRANPLVCLVGGTALLLTASVARAADPAKVDFARQVEPILAKHCYKCHGADKREGGLRLSNKRDALTPGDSGEAALRPGRAAESPLIARITSREEDERMPPEGAPLAAAEVELLRQWIDQGAEWPAGAAAGSNHWAYQRPVRAPLPKVARTDWPKNPIDQFLLARMEKEGLAPAAPLDRPRLARRVSLALTGLPPAPEDVAAFVADTAPKAYERLVDRLLSSPRYGEHWGRQWLDLARYADSNGFQADQLRDSWAYRDWVIEAINADMPFDKFTIEQLAGDLLPDATVAQKIATGFHRTVTCNVEAGVHPEENRVNQVFDRVNTTATVFLGATLECCQCHNHKYDPFSQQEYYQLFAYFNNTPIEVKQTSGVTYDFVGPKMSLPLSPPNRILRADLERRHDECTAQRGQMREATPEARARWEEQLKLALTSPAEWQVLPVASFESNGGEDHRILGDQSVLVSGVLPGVATYTVTVNTKLAGITAFKVEALTHDSLPGQGPGRGDAERTNFILSEFTVRLVEGEKETAVELHSAQADFSQTTWEVAKAIDGNRLTGWAIAPEFHKPHWASFRTRTPVGKAEGSTLKFTLDQNFGRSRTIGRLRLSALVGADTGDIPAEIAAIFKKDGEKKDAVNKESGKKEAGKKNVRTAADTKKLDAFYAAANPELKKLDADLESLKKQLDAIQPPSTLVMVEMDEPRATNVMLRGNYLTPGAKVACGTPAVLHPLDPGLAKNRLGLAKWLVDPRNPLLARVTANRDWAEFFGEPIVSTPEDFGTRADPPTHPELLDWLALEFLEKGWSRKALHKLIVTSAAFQQSASVTPAALEKDPANSLLARGPRFRMSAEMIRDNALAASGLLSTAMGGPPVMPYQPAGFWRAIGRNEPKWIEATDEKRYRRGVYVVWRRAAPYPSFVNFDAPDRASCVVRRPRTNTPLQALTLLNDPAYVEMALALAGRMENVKAGTIEERISAGFRICVAREPSAAELAELVRVYGHEHQQLEKTPARAKSLLEKSVFKLPPGADPLRVAALFYVANILLNLDETITRG